MKQFFKALITPFLALIAHMIVRKYKPTVVMVTGSVGKTSAKDAIASALRERLHVRAPEKSYNSEFGVPLTIIGTKNPWLSPFGWLRVFKEGLAVLLLPNHYPKVLVLEVGADRPGDLERILHIVTPDVVVVTRLPEVPVHVEAYSTPEAVREEEFVPAYGLAPAAPLIVCAEDPYALAYAKRLPITLTTFGYSKGADFQIKGEKIFTSEGRVAGMSAIMVHRGQEDNLVVHNSIGRQQLLAYATAIATATALGLSTAEALAGLEKHTPPPGRMRVLTGAHGTLLIDDSYNSSPIAAEEALRALAGVPKVKRRIAVLGDMLELGRYSVEEHVRIGKIASEVADILVTVGIRARAICEGALRAGFPQANAHCFNSTEEAGSFLSSHITTGDVLLLKGSQSIRMERVVEVLLADQTDASKLVRQEREWKRRSHS